MKKYTKIIALALICVIALTSLVGCDELDKMRAQQAKQISETVISYGGYEYILLPECEYIWQDSADAVYITDSDVPVLLSSLMGQYASISSSGYIITSTFGGNYCRSDKYDQALAAISNGAEMTGYYYNYLYYDMEEIFFTNKTYVLSANEIFAVNRAVSDGAVNFNSADANYLVDLYRCSQDLIFADIAFAVLESSDGYYLYYYDQISEEYLYYAVRAEDTQVFENMLSHVINMYR